MSDNYTLISVIEKGTDEEGSLCECDWVYDNANATIINNNIQIQRICKGCGKIEMVSRPKEQVSYKSISNKFYNN